jgi:nucleotide-binding universal stress UspA family protein
MGTDKVLAAIDFSNITPDVIRCAIYFAQHLNLDITLLHVKHHKSDVHIEEKLRVLTREINQKNEITCDYILATGSIFSEIANAANKPQFKIVVVGTHGFKGFREIMFGADILKLIKTISIPVITVQKGFSFSVDGFQNILFPVASHSSFHQIIDATVFLAKVFDATIHLYSIEKPNLAWSKKLLDNIELAIHTFDTEGAKYIRVNELQSSFSFGYAKQTLEYAIKTDAQLIAMMASPTKEHFYFADSDKELLLTNAARIPVISV